ncbi:MAG: TIGR03905 family TSCPD domain-containing protein [Oscillospiraceae bacterium]|nr:TIGR03905 family TSCPD domain-containing protein [Oscillospiraceae bacterium]
MKHQYKPNGVCAREIEFSLSGDNTISEVMISGGCQGNSAGIARLVVGMKVDDVISRLENIKCGARTSSCPAQLAQALKNYRSSAS